MVLESVLDPVLRPLLVLGPFWFIVVVSFVIALIITIIYKLMTDQEMMKRLKGEMKEMQKELKALRSEPEKMMARQKEVMKKNLEYMKHSLKPTLITFLPIIIIFGWMYANLAYEPIGPGTEFGVKGFFEEGVGGEVMLVVPEGFEVEGEGIRDIEKVVKWKVKAGKEGSYFLDLELKGEVYSKEILVTREQEYKDPVKMIEESDLRKIEIEQKKLRPLGDFSIFGWEPGWLGLYIIFSIIFSMGLRKLLRLY